MVKTLRNSIRNKRLPVGVSVFVFAVLIGYFFLHLAGIRQANIQAVEIRTEMERQWRVCSEVVTDRVKWVQCWQKSLPDAISRWGLTPVLRGIETMLSQNDYSGSGGITACHDLAHVAGKTGMNMLKDKQKAFQSCTPFCGYGCFMGVLEGYFHTNEQFDREYASVCSDDAYPKPCYHALGHAIGDRIGTIEDAVGYCIRLSQSEDRQQCVSGLFMERFEASDYGHALLPIPADMTAFCKTLPDGDGRAICYRRAGFMAYLRTSDISAAVAACESVSDMEKMACIFTLGQEMYYTVRGDAEKLFPFCYGFPDDTRREKCIEGALASSVISEGTARHGVELCGMAKDKLRTFCFDTLGENILNSPNGERNRKTVCNTLAPADAARCLGN